MYIYGFPGDTLKYIYSYWLLNRGLLGSVFPPQFLTLFFLKFNTRSFGEILGYNISLLMVFILAFFSFYFVARKLLFPKIVSILVSVSYSFSNYFLWHGMQNIEIIFASAFLPLYFLSLVYLENTFNLVKISFKQCLVVAFTFSLIFLSSFYIGYFALIFTLFFFLIYRIFSATSLYSDVVGRTRNVILSYSMVGLLVVVFTLPSTIQLISYYIGSLEPSGVREIESGLLRNKPLDLVAYGARPWDYFTPSIYHPVFGRYVVGFYSYLRENLSYQYWSTFLPERANYLTFTLLGLGFYAVFLALRSKSVSLVERRNIIFLMLLSGVMFWVSLPSVISFKGFNFYNPSYFLFKIFSMFRVYARAGVFVLFTFALLGGYGLKLLLQWFEGRLAFQSRVVRTSIGFFFVALVLFENLNFPPLTFVEVSRIPKVYEWIGSQYGDFTIAEYPRDNSVNDLGGGCPDWLAPHIVRDWNGAYEEFYRMFHRKSVFNFRGLNPRELTIVGDLNDSKTYDLLLRNDVSYIIVHTRDPMIGTYPFPYPQENPLDECWQRRISPSDIQVYKGFGKVAEFDDGTIYKVQ